MPEYDTDYIQDEMRCDWLVTADVKKVWSVQTDLLKEFDRICKKHGLRWYPIWGTMLGAVRHQGFIPWDDDVDLGMPRKDYDKFVEICAQELEKPYFLQTTLSEKQCFQMWVSLRNSDTTGNRITCLSKQQNNGIGIDIMPLDGCASDPKVFARRRLPVRIASVLCNTYVNEFNTGKAATMLRKVLRCFKIDYKKIYLWAEKQNRKFAWENHEYVTFRAIADPAVKDLRDVMWKRSDFEETVDMKFENITIPVPKGYDAILKICYGRYMEFPPLDKRQGPHSMVYEPDIPYREYCAKNYGVHYDD